MEAIFVHSVYHGTCLGQSQALDLWFFIVITGITAAFRATVGSSGEMKNIRISLLVPYIKILCFFLPSAIKRYLGTFSDLFRYIFLVFFGYIYMYRCIHCTWHYITFLTIPYHTIPYHTIPYHTIPCIPYHTIPYHTIPYHTIPYHTIPYHTMHTIPYHTIPYHTIPYHTIPYHAYHTIPYHSIPYHTIPYHTIPYHTIPCIHAYIHIYIDLHRYLHRNPGQAGGALRESDRLHHGPRPRRSPAAAAATPRGAQGRHCAGRAQRAGHGELRRPRGRAVDAPGTNRRRRRTVMWCRNGWKMLEKSWRKWNMGVGRWELCWR